MEALNLALLTAFIGTSIWGTWNDWCFISGFGGLWLWVRKSLKKTLFLATAIVRSTAEENDVVSAAAVVVVCGKNRVRIRKLGDYMLPPMNHEGNHWTTKLHWEEYGKMESGNTVDGWNPAPVDMYETL